MKVIMFVMLAITGYCDDYKLTTSKDLFEEYNKQRNYCVVPEASTYLQVGAFLGIIAGILKYKRRS
jgi:hypothetical protein